MKKILLILFTVLLSLNASAQSLRRMWLTMPDSIMPYLNASSRQEFVDFANMKVKADVKNLLNGNNRMDTLTNDYLHVTLNRSATLEMKLLPQQKGDTILCFVKTFYGPSKESEVRFYDMFWHLLPSQGKLPTVTPADFISRPDTMSIERFDNLKAMIEPYLISAKLSQSDNSIVLSLAAPLVGSEDKKDINTIFMQKKLNWENGSFK